MKTIFWGLLFLFIDIRLNQVNVTPSFVGYLMVYSGLRQIADDDSVGGYRAAAVCGAICSGVLWVAELLGFRLDGGMVQWGLALLETGLRLAVTWGVVKGVESLEAQAVTWEAPGRARLKTAWMVMAAASVLSVVLQWIPLLGLAAVVIGFVAMVAFLVVFHGCRKSYRQWEETKQG